MRKNILTQSYLRLSPNTRAAPNPAMTPANGSGVDACGVGFTGEAVGTACVGCASVGAGVAVGSAVAGSQMDAP